MTVTIEDFYGVTGLAMHLLNCTIIPPNAPDGQWRTLTLTQEQASRLHYQTVEAGNCGYGRYPVSHVGHEATAAAMSTAFGSAVATDRTPWDGSGIGLALQLLSRPPEGQILSQEEMAAAGWVWRLIFSERVAERVAELVASGA